MDLRTWVSFEADFPVECKAIIPRGKELATFIAESLSRDGFNSIGPEDLENWAWDLQIKLPRGSIYCIIAAVDDGPRQWAIETVAQVPIFDRLLGKATVHEGHRRFCEALNRTLTNDSRFRTVRWYSPEEWDRGENWGTAP